MADRMRKYLERPEQGFPEGPSFAVSGHFTDNGGVHVAAIETGPDAYVTIPFTEYDLILLDASGAEVASNCLQRVTLRVYPELQAHTGSVQFRGCRTHTTNEFNATLPRIDGGVTLAIERDGARLWTRHAPEALPEITDLRCEIAEGNGRLRWKDNAAPDCPEYRVRAWFENADGICDTITRLVGDDSQRDGHSQGPRNELLFNLAALPAGEVNVRIVLDTGFYSANSEPASLLVPENPVTIELIDGSLMFGLHNWGKVVIHAFAHAFAGTRGQITDPAAFEWTVDGQPVGDGVSLILEPPAVGHHVATVVVRWREQHVSRSLHFEVTPKLLADIAELGIAATNLFRDRRPLPEGRVAVIS